MIALPDTERRTTSAMIVLLDTDRRTGGEADALRWMNYGVEGVDQQRRFLLTKDAATPLGSRRQGGGHVRHVTLLLPRPTRTRAHTHAHTHTHTAHRGHRKLRVAGLLLRMLYLIDRKPRLRIHHQRSSHQVFGFGGDDIPHHPFHRVVIPNTNVLKHLLFSEKLAKTRDSEDGRQ